MIMTRCSRGLLFFKKHKWRILLFFGLGITSGGVVEFSCIKRDVLHVYGFTGRESV